MRRGHVCLAKGAALSITTPPRDRRGPCLSVVIDEPELHGRLFNPPFRTHDAYAWTLHRDGAIVSSPDRPLVGERPFAAMTGRPAASFGPVLDRMKRGHPFLGGGRRGADAGHWGRGS